jgi:RNA polymerase sigma-70 factor (ECF subfamily)
MSVRRKSAPGAGSTRVDEPLCDSPERFAGDAPLNLSSFGDGPRDRSTRFVELLTSHQRKLYGYIAMMLSGDPAAADVLQETNLDLWNRLDDYDLDRPFLPWAFGFARQKVLVYRRTHCRSKLMFGEEALRLINEACIEYATETDDRLIALRQCLQKLNPRQAELIQLRYVARAPVNQMAEKLDETVHNISSRLHRIRKSLAKCIQANLLAEGRQ